MNCQFFIYAYPAKQGLKTQAQAGAAKQRQTRSGWPEACVLRTREEPPLARLFKMIRFVGNVRGIFIIVGESMMVL